METNAKNYKGTELIQSKDLIDKLIVNLSQPESNTFLVSKKVFLEIGTLKPEFILDKLIYAIEAKGTLQDIEISNVYLPLFNDLMSQTYNSHPEKNSILLNLQNKVVRFIENLIDQSIKLSTQFLNDEQMDLLEIREEQVQNAVSNLCKIYPQKMINIIQEIIDPTKPSNLFCLRLLNFVSDSQSQLIFPRINDILSRIMPSFSSIKSDELRIEYCNLIISLIDNLIMQKENQLGFNQESSSSLVLTIFDIIFGQWLQQAQLARARIGCLQSLGYLTHFLSQGKLLSIYEQLIQVYVFSYKKEPCEFFHRITVGFNKFLEKLLFMDKTYLDSLTKSILVSIHQLVTNPFMSSNSKFDPHNLKYKNELLITIQHLSVYSVDTVFDHYIGRLQNKERMEKICALWIIRHLLLRNYDKISENLKKMLNSYLQNLVYETDIEIRYVICEIALIFAQIGVFQVNPDSEYLLYFLLKQISIHELEIKERGQLAQEPFVTTLESLKIRSQQILTVIIKEPCSQEYLWPYILQFLTISQFSPGLVFICKSILQLIKKMQDVYPDCPVEVIHPKFSNHFINIKTDKIPKSQDIILRLVILLYKPYLFENLGYEIIQFLPIILPILHPSFTKIQKQPLNELRVLIKSEYDPTNQLFEKVDKVWLAILNTMNDQEWLQELNESLLNSYKFYQNNPEITGFICKLHGILLSRIDKLDHVKYAIEKMFCICHNEYSNNMINLSVQAQEPLANIRYSVAESFGYVASKHFDLLIDKVRSIFNSEIIGKKQQSAFNMFFSRQDDPDEISDSIKQTLILIIGYVAKHSDPSILTNKIEGSIINNIMPLLEKSQNYQLKCACQKALLLISQSLERVYLFTEGQINEEFKIFISKHRERILTKTQINFSSEKIGDLKIISLMTLCSLFRLDPPFGQDKYVNLFLDAIDIIPNVFDDTFQMFIKPIEEVNNLRQIMYNQVQF